MSIILHPDIRDDLTHGYVFDYTISNFLNCITLFLNQLVDLSLGDFFKVVHEFFTRRAEICDTLSGSFDVAKLCRILRCRSQDRIQIVEYTPTVKTEPLKFCTWWMCVTPHDCTQKGALSLNEFQVVSSF